MLRNDLGFVFGRIACAGVLARGRTYRLPSNGGRASQVFQSCVPVNTPHFAQILKSFGKKTPNALHFLYAERTMKIRYTTNVDPDVDYDPKQFRKEVKAYLADPHGWKSEGYVFVRSSHADVEIHLSSPQTLGSSGCHDSKLSCAEMGGRHMHLNAMRWMKGSTASKLSLPDYRQYMVTHEMGHILGHDHVTCPGPGQPAPLMMQQTVGIGKCKPNTKLTRRDRKKTNALSTRSGRKH